MTSCFLPLDRNDPRITLNRTNKACPASWISWILFSSRQSLKKTSLSFHPVLIISARGRFMSGKESQEEAMLAAVKPLKAANFTVSEDPRPASRPLSTVDSDSLESLFQRHHDRVFR